MDAEYELDKEHDEMLSRIAKELGLTKQQAFSVVLRDFAAQVERQARLKQAKEFVLTHDKDLLDRLGDA